MVIALKSDITYNYTYLDLRVVFRGLHDPSFLAMYITEDSAIPNHNSSHICKSVGL